MLDYTMYIGIMRTLQSFTKAHVLASDIFDGTATQLAKNQEYDR